MTRFALTRQAASDLRAIAIHTQERWGREQCRRYVQQLDEAFHRLAENPQLGKPCDEIRSGYRKLPLGSHVLFYRVATDGVVEIVRILHKRMDVDGGID